MAYLSLPPLPDVPRRNPFDPVADDRHDTLFLDTEKALDYLTPDVRRNVDNWLSVSQDRGADMRYLAVRSYLQDTFGEQNIAPERVDVLRSVYAAHNGIPDELAADNDRFFESVKMQRQRNANRKEFVKGLVSSANDAALSIDPNYVAMQRQAILGDLSAYPDITPDDLPHLMSLYNDTVAAVQFEAPPLRSAARDIAKILKGGQALADKLGDTNPFIEEATARLMQIDKPRRDLVLEFARQELGGMREGATGVGLPGKPKPSAGIGKTKQAVMRGVEDVAGGIQFFGERALEGIGVRDDSDYRTAESRLRALVNGKLAPLSSDNPAMQGLFAAAQSVPAMAMIASGGVGTLLSGMYYQQGSYEKMKADPRLSGVSEAKLNSMATLSAAAQVAGDKLQLKLLTKLPGAGKLVEGLRRVATPANYVAAESLKLGMNLAAETGIEVLQDHYADAVAQQIGSYIFQGVDAPEWAKVNSEALRSVPELTMSMLPLVAVGTVGGSARDIAGARYLASDPAALQVVGFGPSQAAAIAMSDNPVATMRSMWSERNPMEGAPAGATPAEVATQAWTELKDKAEALKTEALDTANSGVRSLQRTADGWIVNGEDGSQHKLETPEAVSAMIQTMRRAHSQEVADAIRQQIDTFAEQDVAAGANPVWTMGKNDNGRAVLNEDGSVSAFDPMGNVLPFDAGTLRNLGEEMRALGMTEGVIRGMNYAVRDDAGKLFRHYSIGEGGDITTVIHERFETLFKSGALPYGQIWEAANALSALPQFDPAKVRNPGEKRVAESLRKMALEDPMSNAEKRETFIELAVADVVGRMKDGTAVAPGSIQEAVRTAALQASPKQRGALNTLKAMLRAVRSYLKTLFGLARRINQARRKGGLTESDAWTKAVDKLLGIDRQAEHNQAVAEQAGAQDATFSLGSIDTLETMAKRLDALTTDPKERLLAYSAAANDIRGMANAIRHNESIDPVLKAGEIERKRRDMQKELEDKYVLAVWEGPVGAALDENVSTRIRDNPFLAKLIDPGKKTVVGRFLAPSKAKRMRGEYEDAIQLGLPKWLFRGEMTPDLIATELGMDLPEMWDRIAQELDSIASLKKDIRSAREQIREAKQRARDEAEAWAVEQRANIPAGEKRDARRAMVALDAMLMKTPPEVRAKVGGFIQLSQLTTEKAREKFLLERVEMMNRAMEFYLKKEYRDRIEKIFDRSEPAGGKGEKAGGKLGTVGHAWFSLAKQASEMKASEAADKVTLIDAKMASEITEEDIQALNDIWGPGTVTDEAGAVIFYQEWQKILETFGGMKDMDAVNLAAAWQAAEDAYVSNRHEWLHVLMERKERLAGIRETAVNEAGGPHDVPKANRSGITESLSGFGDLQLSFEQTAARAFGTGSVHQFVISNARKASDAEFIRMDQKRRAFGEFFRSAFKGSGHKKRAKLMELQERRDTGFSGVHSHLSELQAVHILMLARDESSAEWLAGHGWNEAVIEDLKGWISPEAKAVMQWLIGQYDGQYHELNRVYSRMKGVQLPRVMNYAPRMVENAGKQDEMALDPKSAEGMTTGFLRRRWDKPQGPPKLADALQAYWGSQAVVSHWLAWAETLRDFRGTIASRDVRLSVATHHGRLLSSKLMRWVNHIETNGVREAISASEVGSILRRLFDARSKTALFGRLTVLAAQVPAAVASAAKVPVGAWMRSVARVDSGRAALSWSEMWTSPLIQARVDVEGGLWKAAAAAEKNAPGILLRLFGDFGRTTAGALDIGTEKIGSAIGWTDAAMTTHSALVAWDAAYSQAVESGMPEDEAKRMAWESASIVVGQTAQPMQMIDKSLFEVEWPTTSRLIFAFQGANRQAWSLMYQAARNVVKDPKEFGKIMALYSVVIPTLVYVAKGLVRYLTSDDDWKDEWSLKQWGQQMAVAPLQGLVVVGPAVEHLITAEPSNSDEPIVSAMIQAKSALGKLFEDEESRMKRPKEERDFSVKDAGRIVNAVAQILGGRTASIGVANNLVQEFMGGVAAVREGDQGRESARAKKNAQEAKKSEREAAQKRAREAR